MMTPAFVRTALVGLTASLWLITTSCMVPPDQDGDEPFPITCDVLAGLLIERVEPRFPAEAIEGRQQGLVLMDVVVNKQGAVSSVRIVAGPMLFRESAEEAILQWRYRPYLLDGEPLDVTARVGLRFRLPDDDTSETEQQVCR